MQSYIRAVTTLSRACGVFAMILIAAAVLVVTQMVFIRYALNGSTIWQTEFVTYALMASTFLGCPYVLMLKGHVNVDLLPNALNGKPRIAMEAFHRLLSLLFCALLAWSSGHYFLQAYLGGWTTETVWALPLWIPLLPLPVGIGLLALQYIAELMQLAQGDLQLEAEA